MMTAATSYTHCRQFLKEGKLIWDYALGMNGVIISGPWRECRLPSDLDWEWLVMYEDGELHGADSNDLCDLNEAR